MLASLLPITGIAVVAVLAAYYYQSADTVTSSLFADHARCLAVCLTRLCSPCLVCLCLVGSFSLEFHSFFVSQFPSRSSAGV